MSKKNGEEVDDQDSHEKNILVVDADFVFNVFCC